MSAFDLLAKNYHEGGDCFYGQSALEAIVVGNSDAVQPNSLASLDKGVGLYDAIVRVAGVHVEVALEHHLSSLNVSSMSSPGSAGSASSRGRMAIC